MPTERTLHIINEYPEQTLSFTVSSSGWNCCDFPVPGDTIDGVDYNTSKPLRYARKGGHGCDGEQGKFVLLVTGNGKMLGQQGLEMDAEGDLQLTANSATGAQFQSLLSQPNPDGSYSWAVFPPAESK